MERDEQFVQDVVKAIVDNPDKVSTNRTVDEMGVLIELTVDPADMGKIIGKEGKTAKSIRTLLRVLGAKNNARVNLKIVEPEGSEHVRKEDRVEEKVEDSGEAEKVEEEKAPEKDELSDVPADILDEE
jgi:predicted RNA-binding protein YlqC (UPF0109 family)